MIVTPAVDRRCVTDRPGKIFRSFTGDHHQIHPVDPCGRSQTSSRRISKTCLSSDQAGYLFTFRETPDCGFHQYPIRMRSCTPRTILFRLQDLHECIILTTILQQHFHIPACTVVILVMKSRRIYKVCIPHPKLGSFAVHMVHKSLYRAVNTICQGIDAFRSGRQSHTI